MTETAQALAGWSLAASMAVLLAAMALRGGRRRSAINEALHELRRPLQSIALSVSAGGGRGGGGPESAMRLVSAALERLDREVNGDDLDPVRDRVRFESILRSAVGRWRARVALDGGSLELRWRGGDSVVEGDRAALEQAVDNLIVNAIEHGGPVVLVEGWRHGDRLLVSVVDRGSAARGAARGSRPGALSRLTGRRRHGYGLAVVRGVAAAHGGRFVLRHSAGETSAVLELPLADANIGPAA